MPTAQLKVFRGSPGRPGGLVDFEVPVEEGMVILDALHWIQGHAAPDLAVRWNCKAAKCGSCSAEVNGRPCLTCKTRLSDFDLEEPITVEPMRAFPLIRDLVTDVSWNYAVNRTIQPFTPPADVPQPEWRWRQEDIERVQEFRKCIECFLCQDVCHVLRNHETERPFMGPRFIIRAAGLEMHPIDQGDRLEYLKDDGGLGYCNITKCCTEVCPEHIKITDNGIIPLKERVADRYYDPLQVAWRKLRRGGETARPRQPLPVLSGPETPRAARPPVPPRSVASRRVSPPPVSPSPVSPPPQAAPPAEPPPISRRGGTVLSTPGDLAAQRRAAQPGARATPARKPREARSDSAKPAADAPADPKPRSSRKRP